MNTDQSKLLALINATQSSSITDTQISFSDPSVYEGDDSRSEFDTQITVTATEDNSSVDIRYLRQDIGQVFLTGGAEIPSFNFSTETDASGLIPLLNDRYQTNYLPEYFDVTFTAAGDQTAATAVISPTPTNIRFTGTLNVTDTQYHEVTLPSAITSWFTYKVYADNTTTYDPLAFKPSGTVAYISPTGLDTNDGLTAETAKKTIAGAGAVADIVGVVAMAGRYPMNVWATSSMPANVLGVWCDDGVAEFIAGNLDDSANFTLSETYTNTYVWEGLTACYDVRDEANPSVFGRWGWITKLTTPEDVDATENSYYYDTTNDILYLRLKDDRVPDAYVRVFQQDKCYIGKSSIAMYMGNLHWGGICVQPNPNGTSVVLHMDHCEYGYNNGTSAAAFLTEPVNNGFIIHSYKCKSYANRLDGFSYRSNAKGVEIDCESFDNPSSESGGSNNASTMHGSAVVLYIGGKYHDAVGDVLASVSTGTMCCVGTWAGYGSVGNTGSDFNSTVGPIYTINCSNDGSDSQYGKEGGGTWYTQNSQFTSYISATPVASSFYVGPGIRAAEPIGPTAGAVVSLGSITTAQTKTVTVAELIATAVPGDKSTLSVVDLEVSSGTLSGLGFGPWVFTPASSGTVTFTYKVIDFTGKYADQTATLIVS